MIDDAHITISILGCIQVKNVTPRQLRNIVDGNTPIFLHKHHVEGFLGRLFNTLTFNDYRNHVEVHISVGVRIPVAALVQAYAAMPDSLAVCGGVSLYEIFPYLDADSKKSIDDALKYHLEYVFDDNLLLSQESVLETETRTRSYDWLSSETPKFGTGDTIGILDSLPIKGHTVLEEAVRERINARNKKVYAAISVHALKEQVLQERIHELMTNTKHEDVEDYETELGSALFQFQEHQSKVLSHTNIIKHKEFTFLGCTLSI